MIPRTRPAAFSWRGQHSCIPSLSSTTDGLLCIVLKKGEIIHNHLLYNVPAPYFDLNIHVQYCFHVHTELMERIMDLSEDIDSNDSVNDKRQWWQRTSHFGQNYLGDKGEPHTLQRYAKVRRIVFHNVHVRQWTSFLIYGPDTRGVDS